MYPDDPDGYFFFIIFGFFICGTIFFWGKIRGEGRPPLGGEGGVVWDCDPNFDTKKIPFACKCGICSSWCIKPWSRMWLNILKRCLYTSFQLTRSSCAFICYLFILFLFMWKRKRFESNNLFEYHGKTSMRHVSW